MKYLEFLVSRNIVLMKEGSVRASFFVLHHCEFSGIKLKSRNTTDIQVFLVFFVLTTRTCLGSNANVAKLMSQFFPILQ